MKPYFDTNHVTAVLLLMVTMAWGMMELAKASNARQDGIKVGGGGRRIATLPTLAAAAAALYLAPLFVPSAAIRPAAAVFAVGIVVMVGGLVLRGWSIMTLGDYFTGRVIVSPDQPVITAGPYRVLRHPSYTGFLLACIGIGLASANWAGLAAMVLLPLAVVFWRIRAEENALAASVGDRYRAYAAQHKRLVPFVW
jgi:protein-S-isoprenylcysteine O-methyltransferase Ste14